MLFHNGDDACAVHPVPDGTGANRCQLTRALCCNDSRSVCPVSYEVSFPGLKGACLHDDAGGGRRSSGTGHHVPEASCHPEACLQNAGGEREEADEARGARATGLSARRAGNQATGIIGITGRYVAGSPQSAANILNMHGFVVLGVQHTVADSDLDALKDVMIEEAQRKEAYPICSMKYGYALAASIALEDVASGFGPLRMLPWSERQNCVPFTEFEEKLECSSRRSLLCVPKGCIFVRDVRCPHSGSPNLYDRPRVIASVQILSPEYQARESRRVHRNDLLCKCPAIVQEKAFQGA